MVSMGNDGNIRPFVHPYMQTWGMFAGEIGCLVVYLLDNLRRNCIRSANGSNIGLFDPVLDAPKFQPLLFVIPAMLALASTCISYTGLILTYASSYQMLRSASIIFTAFLTQFVLKTAIRPIRWLGVLFIVCGLVTVGVTGKTLDHKAEIISNLIFIECHVI